MEVRLRTGGHEPVVLRSGCLTRPYRWQTLLLLLLCVCAALFGSRLCGAVQRPPPESVQRPWHVWVTTRVDRTHVGTGAGALPCMLGCVQGRACRAACRYWYGLHLWHGLAWPIRPLLRGVGRRGRRTLRLLRVAVC